MTVLEAISTASQRRSKGGFRLSSAAEITDHAALNALLLEYYGVISCKLAAAGVPRRYSPEELIAPFWANIGKFLPPHGRLMLVHGPSGALVGCGTLQQIRPDAGELKRLYLKPEAQGYGLGRALVEARIKAARDMGWRTLYVNTIIGNRDMLKIYEKVGFQHISRYPECSDPIEVDPYFEYMTYRLR